jgi:Na+-driven multidrug efflux pump
LLFVTNAAFNNLGRPLWATGLNWARQTIGIIPFIWIGAQLGGLRGIAYGSAIGAVPFALLALFMAFNLINKQTLAAPTSAPESTPAE